MGEHFQFVYARLPTELAENRQKCPTIPPLKNGVGLFLFCFRFKVTAPFVERNVRIENIKLWEGVEKKPSHIWKIADTVFETNVWENISDVNRAASIIHTRKRTSLKRTSDSRYFFLYHCDINF